MLLEVLIVALAVSGVVTESATNQPVSPTSDFMCKDGDLDDQVKYAYIFDILCCPITYFAKVFLNCVIEI